MVSGKASLGAQLKELSERAKAGVVQAQEDAAAGVALSRLVLLGTGLSVLCMLVLASYAVVRSVWRDLGGEPQDLRDQVHRIAEGDLRLQLEGPQSPDGSLAHTPLEMSHRLSDIVVGLRQGADLIAGAASEVASARLQQTAATTEQITETVKQTAEAA